ncbi:MAG: hypothetical protein Fur0042_21180 [Cyanophyceae cyanobacterium]
MSFPPPLDSPLSAKAEQILEGGFRAFLAQGYAGTSMDRVAAEARVSKATVYSYFRDKESLFAALVQRAAHRKLPVIYAASAIDAPPRQALRHLCQTLLERLVNDPEHLEFVRLTVGESGRFPALAQLFLQTLTKSGIEAFRDCFQRYPQLQNHDCEALASIVTGALISWVFTQEILHGREILPMDRDRYLNCLIDLVLPSDGFPEEFPPP